MNSPNPTPAGVNFSMPNYFGTLCRYLKKTIHLGLDNVEYVLPQVYNNYHHYRKYSRLNWMINQLTIKTLEA